jgi:uncharacterized protein YjiS (DUF1127 family)
MPARDTLARLLRTIGDRRAVRAMTELDDRTLADIGLLRTDVHAALARPVFAMPSGAVRDCCGARLPSRTLACC